MTSYRDNRYMENIPGILKKSAEKQQNFNHTQLHYTSDTETDLLSQ